MDDALPLGRPVLSRADALAAGLDDRDLARAVRRGELTRIRRGAYADPAAGLPRHRALVLVTAPALRDGSVVSHASAAALHGLPLWRVEPDRMQVTRRPPGAGSGSARVHLHVARLPDDEVTLVDGVLVTRLARTVVDLARSLPFESAVIAADAALASGEVSREDLGACRVRMGPVPGSRRGARVLAFADGRSESAGESHSRVVLHRLGLSRPELQLEVRDREGQLLGRCDSG